MLKRLKLKNYKCFKDYETTFSKTTFIRGSNGIGKSTLGTDAYLLLVFGYSKLNLSNLPTRNVAKSLTIEGDIEYKGDLYTIVRNIPTKLSIKKNGEELKFATSTEAQRYLNSLFGDIHSFKKFRMIDSDIGVNFLEEGEVALKKILFSTSETLFNNIRDRLAKIKRDRELLNKDRVVLSTHYPSEKRLNILTGSIQDLEIKIAPLTQEKNKTHNELLTYQRNQGGYETNKRNLEREIGSLEKENKCYTCKQDLTVANRDTLILNKKETWAQLIGDLEDNRELIEETQDMMKQFETKLAEVQPRIRELEQLVSTLKTRIQQKEYIYTNADIEVVKRAIKELDNLSTNYLIATLRTLEPIINSVLDKINFKVFFKINDKGKFSITLKKEEVEYDYKDLSTGQKLILQIAFKLALLLNKGETGLIIADEGMSSLDNENLTYILNMFDNYPYQLIFMLHNFNKVPDSVRVIDLEKED